MQRCHTPVMKALNASEDEDPFGRYPIDAANPNPNQVLMQAWCLTLSESASDIDPLGCFKSFMCSPRIQSQSPHVIIFA